ncbi:MAG: hypothetical protein K0R48_1443, partial [Gammaproteobacteria bacterium]|nr:hypothetical protein [Gammaproteobacteria bacterium]
MSANSPLVTRYIVLKQKAVHYLMCQKDAPSFNDKTKGFYLYRAGDLEEIQVLVIHDSKTHEILNLTQLTKENQQYQQILNGIKWPDDKDTEVKLDEELVQFITLSCQHPYTCTTIPHEHRPEIGAIHTALVDLHHKRKPLLREDGRNRTYFISTTDAVAEVDENYMLEVTPDKPKSTSFY